MSNSSNDEDYIDDESSVNLEELEQNPDPLPKNKSHTNKTKKEYNAMAHKKLREKITNNEEEAMELYRN